MTQRDRRQSVFDPVYDPNVIYGPVCQVPIWQGSPDNVVGHGWSHEIYTRADGIVDCFFPRIARTESTAVRWRREMIKLNRELHGDCSTLYVCNSDAELLATIRRVWG